MDTIPASTANTETQQLDRREALAFRAEQYARAKFAAAQRRKTSSLHYAARHAAPQAGAR
jgi:hypothetical protein